MIRSTHANVKKIPFVWLKKGTAAKTRNFRPFLIVVSVWVFLMYQYFSRCFSHFITARKIWSRFSAAYILIFPPLHALPLLRESLFYLMLLLIFPLFKFTGLLFLIDVNFYRISVCIVFLARGRELLNMRESCAWEHDILKINS